MKFILADGTMHAHSSEMPVGTYKKGHRHGADFYVFTVHGTGYSLLWYPGQKEFERIDWKHGVVFVPPDNMFHQHFNTNLDSRHVISPWRWARCATRSSNPSASCSAAASIPASRMAATRSNTTTRMRASMRSISRSSSKNGVDSRDMGKSIDESKYAALLKKTA